MSKQLLKQVETIMLDQNYLPNMLREINEVLQGEYLHHKSSNVYTYLLTSIDEVTGELTAIYSNSSGTVFNRQLKVFLETVSINDVSVPRFEKIEYEDVSELKGCSSFAEFEKEYDHLIFYADGQLEPIIQAHLDEPHVGELDIYYFDNMFIGLLPPF